MRTELVTLVLLVAAMAVTLGACRAGIDMARDSGTATVRQTSATAPGPAAASAALACATATANDATPLAPTGPQPVSVSMRVDLPAGADVRRPTAVSLTEHDGPVVVVYEELLSRSGLGDGRGPARRVGNQLVQCALGSDGAAGPALHIVSPDWTAYTDPAPTAGFSSASYLWLGEHGLIVWDEPIRWWLGGAEIAGGESSDIACPSFAGGLDASPVWDPDLCRAGERVCLAAIHEPDTGVVIASAPVQRPHNWTPYLKTSLTGRGMSQPAIAAQDRGGLYVACTEVAVMPEPPGMSPATGPIVLCRSDDGETWSEPMPTVDESKAHSSALAADDDTGLVMVYTAEREDGWPLLAARSPDFGETWGEPVMLSAPDIRCYRPDALVCDGKLYVAYLEVPKEPPPGRGRLALGDPTGVYTMVLDPAELPAP